VLIIPINQALSNTVQFVYSLVEDSSIGLLPGELV